MVTRAKKTVTLCLAFTLLLTLTVGAFAAYNPGTYTAEVRGHNGPIKVSATFSKDAITAVEVLEHAETVGVGTPAIERLSKEIVEHQSLGLDTVSGATITSYAVLAGVSSCVKQAGGDVDALRAKVIEKTPGPKITKTADVVVIGAGGAGIAAAMSAVENGASVIVIEKNAAIGGNTLISGCAWNAANPALSSTTPAATGLNQKLQSFLEMDETELPPEFRPTLRVLKEQIATYLAGDTSMMFDSVELH
ncbi:MAG: FMN-binding protein, partial [Firmicutes bacterium]|nr:FMN-binding protein [Bacillota bacterium]